MSKAKKVAAKKISKATKVKGVVRKAVNGQNPYRIGGGYWASVEALRMAGINKMHLLYTLLPLVKKAMGEEAYKAFAAKPSKLDADARCIVNLHTVSRKDYGRPLVENGLHVVFDGKGKTAGLYKIGQEPAVKPKAEKTPATKPAAKKAKGKKTVKAEADPTKCGRCNQPLKLYKDKGEEKATLTCPDCGWRHGDRKGVVSPKQIALAASATKSK